jgi:alpha-beta hydrolase superfamily lysophospholipase
MRTTTTTFLASDGAPLHLYTWSPDDGPAVRGVAHVAHGMAEHAGRYVRLADALTRQGFIVYAHDHRGHGKSAKPGELGHLGDGGWARVVLDFRELLLSEMREHEGLPFFLFAHSMGSYMAQELLFDMSDRFAAVALSGSNGKPPPIAAAGRVIARAEKLRVGAKGTSRVLSGLSFEAFNKKFAPNRTACDWLSRDEAEVDAYVADPLCGFDCSTTTWIGLLDALAHIANPELQARIRPDLPLYVFAGKNDPVSDETAGLDRLLQAYERAGLRDVTHRFYEGARHEILNETNREEVTRDLLDWVTAKVYPSRR